MKMMQTGRKLEAIKVLLKFVVVMVAAEREAHGALEADFLGPHNAARAKVGVAALAWDTKLEAYAVSYAANNGAQCQLVHSQGPYGENLFWGGAGKAWTAADAVRQWVDEARFYDYASNTCASGRMCGHYTQVVWRTTTRLGCASQTCRDGSTFIICNYSPPGNYVNQRPY